MGAAQLHVEKKQHVLEHHQELPDETLIVQRTAARGLVDNAML